jgi:hypothetical protein
MRVWKVDDHFVHVDADVEIVRVLAVRIRNADVVQGCKGRGIRRTAAGKTDKPCDRYALACGRYEEIK